MKIKSIALALLVIVTMLLLSACGMRNINEETIHEKQFAIVEDYNVGRVIVDKETGVMYWLSMGGYNNGNLTLLVNPDGTPKTYGGER